MRPRILTLVSALAVVLSAPLTGAEAQMRQGMHADGCEAGMGMMCMMGEHARMGMMGEAAMQQRVDRRLTALKAQLKITDAQTKAWDGYAGAVRDAAKVMVEQRKAMHEKAAGSTLPQRLDLHEAMMVSHLEHLRKTKTAAAALYAVLTDEQKKIADTAMTGPMRRGMQGPRPGR